MVSPFSEYHNETSSQCDQNFGPAVASGLCVNSHDPFDFTPLFEQSIMILGPSVFFLLAFSLRWVQLYSQTRKVLRVGLLGHTKVVSKWNASLLFSNRSLFNGLARDGWSYLECCD